MASASTAETDIRSCHEMDPSFRKCFVRVSKNGADSSDKCTRNVGLADEHVERMATQRANDTLHSPRSREDDFGTCADRKFLVPKIGSHIGHHFPLRGTETITCPVEDVSACRKLG